MPRVFICYSRKDSDFVDKLTADLKAAGVPVWRDVDDIPEDEASSTFSWRRAVDRALVKCTHMVVVLSPDANESAEVQAEWNDFVSRGLPVFPVKCRETRVPYRLNSLNWVDLQHGYGEKVAKLGERIKRVIKSGDARGSSIVTDSALLRNDEVITLTVSKLGRGQYRSITNAINAAPVGARLIVEQGHYDECIDITKPLEIVGVSGKEVTVENANMCCLKLSTDYAVVRNMSFLHKQNSGFGIDVSDGHLILQGCDVRSENSSIGIYGSNSKATIRDCTIHDSTYIGLHIYLDAVATIESSDIVGSGMHNFQIDKAVLTVLSCNIYGAKQSGILVNSGNLIAEKCNIHHNEWGIWIQNGGSATIRASQIRENNVIAVVTAKVGTVIVEDCDLTGNRVGSWSIHDESTVTRRNNKE